MIVIAHWPIIHKHLYLDQRKALPCLRALSGESFDSAMDLKHALSMIHIHLELHPLPTGCMRMYGYLERAECHEHIKDGKGTEWAERREKGLRTKLCSFLKHGDWE